MIVRVMSCLKNEQEKNYVAQTVNCVLYSAIERRAKLCTMYSTHKRVCSQFSIYFSRFLASFSKDFINKSKESLHAQKQIKDANCYCNISLEIMRPTEF